MSDNLGIRTISGNFGGRDRETFASYSGKRRLVEECEIVRIEAVQRAFGKKALLAAIRQAQSFRVPVFGGHFDIWLVDVPHSIPGRAERWSSREDGTVRLYLWCPSCQKIKLKLYYYFFPDSSGPSELWCWKCHGLTYLSVNSGKNCWYRQVARPMKQLLKEKDRLEAKKPTARIQARLAQIERQIQSLREQARPKTSPPRRPRWSHRSQAIRPKRRYRDLSLIGDGMGNPCVARPSAPTSQRSKPLAQRKPLLREREPGELAHFVDAVRQAQLRMAVDLQPLAEKVVQEAEQLPEWAGSLKLAEAKKTLDTMRRVREQYGRTEAKQRAAPVKTHVRVPLPVVLS